MKIRLQNIGLIKDSTIKLDGLTVITGHNNSGKTTVGKVLYSLIDSVSNLEKKAHRDKIDYTFRVVVDVIDSLDTLEWLYDKHNDIFSEWTKDNAILIKLLRQPRHLTGEDISPSSLRKLKDVLTSIDLEFFDTKLKTEITGLRRSKQDITMLLRSEINDAIATLDKLLIQLDIDNNLVNYTRVSLNSSLRLEFANQIQPILQKVKKSQIQLEDENSTHFDIEIIDNNIIEKKEPIFFKTNYKRAFLIDDPYVLDTVRDPFFRTRGYILKPSDNLEAIFDNRNQVSHGAKLTNVLRNNVAENLFEKTIKSDSLQKIKNKINNIIGGDFKFSNEGCFYIIEGKELDISNLATGSKMFSIIKLLVEKGFVDSSTVLILDEPEAHLHPEWQNKFAEIVTLLVKELEVCVLLTTHSPNFMLAIDAFMRKYGINEKCNFYQTIKQKDGFVEYKDVSDDMGQIYDSFVKHLSEVRILRNKYINQGSME